jgi:hypothetical protein
MSSAWWRWSLFIGFHLVCMQALLRIGLFPWACAIAWLPFIPGSAWDWAQKKLRLPASSARKVDRENHRFWPLLDYAGCGLVFLAAVDVMAWNISSLPGAPKVSIHTFGSILAQRWNMYAPYPRKVHGWLVVPADLANGQQVDLFTGKALSWDKPKDIGAYFGDDLWRRFISNLFDNQNPADLKRYADYQVRKWDQIHSPDKDVQTVSIIFMRETTLPNFSVSPAEKDALYFETFAAGQ